MQVSAIQNQTNFNGEIVILGKYGKGSLEHITKNMKNIDFVKNAACNIYVKDFRNLILGKKENWIGIVATKDSKPETVPLWLWQECKTKNPKNILEAIKNAINNPDPDILYYQARFGALENFNKSKSSLLEKIQKFLSSIIK
jgi:hypothetical protein